MLARVRNRALFVVRIRIILFAVIVIRRANAPSLRRHFSTRLDASRRGRAPLARPRAASRARMVELTIVPSWDGKGVTWRPIFDDDEEAFAAYTHACEYAKSGRGKCGKCGEKVRRIDESTRREEKKD